jgi:hypothetical protein
MRVAAILLFAAAAILVGVGNSSGERWLSAVSFGLFGAGVILFLRWRSANRARVLDREEKTTEEDA